MLGDGKSVVLSFDDGPAPVDALESILQTLREHEIRAEFYVLGNEVEQYPDAARLIVRQGHAIQNHSWSHLDLAKAPKGLGPEKIRNIERQFTQQRHKALFNILMHVQPATARELPSFISQLKAWGFAIAQP
jgi:hypothetical protein